MNYSQGVVKNLAVRLYERLLRLYPPRFRRNFVGEIHAIFLDRMGEPGNGMSLAVRELAGLARSILRERWHEWRTRKGDDMDTQSDLSNEGGGAAMLQSASVPPRGVPWMIGWILLPLVIIPILRFVTLPLTVPYQWILNLGTLAGLWPAISTAALQTLGFMTGLGLSVAGAEWFMLRGYLPRPGRWFAATALGIWLGGIAGVLLDLEGLIVTGRTPDWRHPIELIVIGLILGLTQWLLLRDQIEKAFWFVPIDLIAVLSFLPIRWAYIYTFLLIFLPGIITGIGLWLLLRYSAAKKPLAAKTASIHKKRASTWLRIGVGLAVFFFGGLGVNATLLLEKAKVQGAYPTFEEAVNANSSRGWEEGGVKIIGITIDASYSSPAIVNGKQQHVRRGCANIQLDRIPAGYEEKFFPMCSYYVHTRDGWVMMGEDQASFVGWVMELYNLEGLHEFRNAY